MEKTNKRKIKIVRIITRLNIGGPAQHVVILSKELDQDRFETILVTGAPMPQEGDMASTLDLRGIKHIKIRWLKRQINPICDLVAFIQILAILLRERPQILCTHTAKAGALGRLAGICAFIPIRIHTFHGHIFWGYFGKVKTGFFITIEKILARLTDCIITLSELQRKEIGGILGIEKHAKLILIPLGIDLGRFKELSKSANKLKEKLGIPKGDNIIALVGRLVEIKNPKLFLDIAHYLVQENGCKNIKFVIVGGGHLRDSLMLYAKKLNIEKEVFFTGWMNRVEDVYKDIDVLLLTSDNEGTPLSVIEAMACSKVVIARNVGGVPDVIVDKRTGFLVADQNPALFGSIIIKCLDDRRLMQEIGEKAAISSWERYRKERLVTDIEVLYEKLIKERINI